MGGLGFVICAAALGALIAGLVRAWAYVVLLALIEVSWVGLCCVTASLAVETLDHTWLFWATALMVFSAVELVLSAFAFAALSNETSGAYLPSDD